jgi:hypothetical protein
MLSVYKKNYVLAHASNTKTEIFLKINDQNFDKFILCSGSDLFDILFSN